MPLRTIRRRCCNRRATRRRRWGGRSDFWALVLTLQHRNGQSIRLRPVAPGDLAIPGTHPQHKTQINRRRIGRTPCGALLLQSVQRAEDFLPCEIWCLGEMGWGSPPMPGCAAESRNLCPEIWKFTESIRNMRHELIGGESVECRAARFFCKLCGEQKILSHKIWCIDGVARGGWCAAAEKF